MLRLKSTIAVGVMLAFTASAALADGMPRAAMKTAPVQPSWTGCYVGLGGGYGMYDLHTHLTSTAGFNNVSLDQGGMGWFGTAQVGCDYQFSGRWVVGAFIDGDLSDITGKHTGGNVGVGLFSGDMQLSSSWATGARLGYLVNPTFLTFVSAGFTQAKFDGTKYVTPTGANAGVSVPGQTYDGYFLGGGVEYALGFHPGLFWKTEYRFADYSAETLRVFTTATGAPNGFLESTHPYVQTVRTELVWRF